MRSTLKLLCFISALAATNADAQTNYPDWKSVGKAKLTVLWFDIYQAELSSQTGVYDSEESFKLTLTYLRDFEAKDLVEETFNQMPGPLTKLQINNWQNRLISLWPDVNKQDSISFLKDEKGRSHFYYNQNYLGAIEDPLFSEQFAAIWLAPTSEYPKLAKQLKGNNHD
jgi:hypothetical protein